MDVVDQVERLLFHVELDRLGQVLEHKLASLHHMLRLRVVVALIVLFLLVERLKLGVLVDFREDALVVEDLKAADARIAAVLEHEQVRFIKHLLHADGLVVARRLADFPPFPLVVLDLLRMVDSKLGDRLLVLLQVVIMITGHIRQAVLLELVSSRCMQKRGLRRDLAILPSFSFDYL